MEMRPHPEIIEIGIFGMSVAREIRTLLDDVDHAGVAQRHATACAPATASVFLTACARNSRQDQAAYEAMRRGLPFIPLLLDNNMLRLGPVVLPNGDICWECWNARRLQTSAFPNELQILDRLYDSDPDSGPKGFPSFLVVIAAASIVRLLCDEAVLQNSKGLLWETNIFTREVSCSTVSGIDACPQCGLKRPPKTRSYVDLVRDLGSVATINRQIRS